MDQGFNADLVFLGKDGTSGLLIRSATITFSNVPAGGSTPAKFGGFDGSNALVTRTPAEVLADIGGIGLASLSAVSPLVYNSLTGAFSMPAAGAAAAGYVTTGGQSFGGEKTFASIIVGGRLYGTGNVSGYIGEFENIAAVGLGVKIQGATGTNPALRVSDYLGTVLFNILGNGTGNIVSDFSVNGLLTALYGTFTRAVDAENALSVGNTSAGSSAAAALNCGNDLQVFRGQLLMNSSNRTPSGIYYADGLLLRTGGVGGLTIAADSVSGIVRIYSGNALAATFGTGQVLTLTNLAGTGTRMMVVDPSGDVSTQAIPGGGGGSVTGVAVASANGLAGSSDGAAVVPTLTLRTTVNAPVLAGNGTAISAAATTGTGSTVVLSTSPVLTTPDIGSASGSSLSVTGLLTSTGGGVYSNGAVSSNTVGMGSLVQIYNSAAVRGWIQQLNASQGLDFWHLDGSWAIMFTFGSTGNFNAAGNISAANFSGSSSGTNTGDQTSVTGNAGTATILQTARNIQGVSFNGSANIDIINGTGFVKSTGTTLSYDNTAYAPLASPALTGNPTAPTQSPGNNSTRIATTAFVTAAAATAAASGTYTPTITLGTNAASSTAFLNKYTRVGTIVTVYGRALITFTSAINTAFTVSLPIATNMADSNTLVGTGSMDENGTGVHIDGALPANTANIRFLASAPASGGFVYYTFQYEIL
jgi:hypothetical protein